MKINNTTNDKLVFLILIMANLELMALVAALGIHSSDDWLKKFGENEDNAKGLFGAIAGLGLGLFAINLISYLGEEKKSSADRAKQVAQTIFISGVMTTVAGGTFAENEVIKDNSAYFFTASLAFLTLANLLNLFIAFTNKDAKLFEKFQKTTAFLRTTALTATTPFIFNPNLRGEWTVPLAAIGMFFCASELLLNTRMLVTVAKRILGPFFNKDLEKGQLSESSKETERLLDGDRKEKDCCIIL